MTDCKHDWEVGPNGRGENIHCRVCQAPSGGFYGGMHEERKRVLAKIRAKVEVCKSWNGVCKVLTELEYEINGGVF